MMVLYQECICCVRFIRDICFTCTKCDNFKLCLQVRLQQVIRFSLHLIFVFLQCYISQIELGNHKATHPFTATVCFVTISSANVLPVDFFCRTWPHFHCLALINHYLKISQRMNLPVRENWQSARSHKKRKANDRKRIIQFHSSTKWISTTWDSCWLKWSTKERLQAKPLVLV